MKYKHIHFIGIGGIGVSGAAFIALESGFQVSGSDIVKSDLTNMLQKKGATIYIGDHRASHLEKSVDLVVYSHAIALDNSELKEAHKREIQTQTYYVFLGNLFKHKTSIAIIGMHGKSTTTALISKILLDAKRDPSLLIGTKVPFLKKRNARLGKGDLFIVEGDEYKKGFLGYHPSYVCLLNIEEEHLDSYADLDDILKTFSLFLGRIPKNGVLVYHESDEHIAQILSFANCRLISFGTSNDASFVAKEIKHVYGKTNFTVFEKGKKRGTIQLQIPGEHNVLNAMAALTLCLNLGVTFTSIKKTLGMFQGTWRRFEYVGKKDGIVVIDDYAHHPTEIMKTLIAFQQVYPDKRRICVLQLHQYIRVKSLYQKFIEAVHSSSVDLIIITDFYFVQGRDDQRIAKKINAQKFTDDLKKLGSPARYIKRDALVSYLKKILRDGDAVITMGAGDITLVGHELITRS